MFLDSQDLGIQLNQITTNTYDQWGVLSQTSGVSRIAQSGEPFFDCIDNNAASNEKGSAQFRVFCNPASELLNVIVMGGGDVGTIQTQGENTTANTTTITEVKLMSSGAGNNIRDGSVLNVYKVSGS